MNISWKLSRSETTLINFMNRKIQNSNDVTKLPFFFLMYFGIYYYCNVLFMSSSCKESA